MYGYWVDKKNGLLQHDRTVVRQVPASDMGGAFVPELVVMHYTASSGFDSTVRHLSLQDAVYVSAHLCIARDGTVAQLVPFNRIAYHAGVSEYKGRKGCNKFSIGIELMNWGYCGPAEQKPVSWTGTFVPEEECLVASHKNGGPRGWWQKYTEKQLETTQQILEALAACYPTITDVVGHDDVSPGRKQDPGPAFESALVNLRNATLIARGKTNDIDLTMPYAVPDRPSFTDLTEYSNRLDELERRVGALELK